MFGSYNFTGLESDFCFDRRARFDPYGYDEDDLDQDPNDHTTKVKPRNSRAQKVLWDKVNWGLLQGDCLLSNRNRFEPMELGNLTLPRAFSKPSLENFENVDDVLVFPTVESISDSSYRAWSLGKKAYKQRSAVVLRTEDTNEWSIDTTQYLRSMIMELSLHSGAEYEIILLVEVKDSTLPIFDDPTVYRETMLKSVPAEFGNITVLFNKPLLEKWYPKAGVQE